MPESMMTQFIVAFMRHLVNQYYIKINISSIHVATVQ